MKYIAIWLDGILFHVCLRFILINGDRINDLNFAVVLFSMLFLFGNLFAVSLALLGIISETWNLYDKKGV